MICSDCLRAPPTRRVSALRPPSSAPCPPLRGSVCVAEDQPSLPSPGDCLMPLPATLLISRNRALVEAVQGVFDTIDHLRLEVCSNAEQARREVTREDVVLVLAHLESVGGDAGITQLLWTIAATRRPCPTLVLSDQYTEHQAATL